MFDRSSWQSSFKLVGFLVQQLINFPQGCVCDGKLCGEERDGTGLIEEVEATEEELIRNDKMGRSKTKHNAHRTRNCQIKQEVRRDED